MNLQNFFTYQKISKELSTEILNQYEMSESEQMTHSIFLVTVFLKNSISLI